MRRLLVLVMISLLGLGTVSSWAAELTDDNYRDIDKLRSDLVKMRRQMDRFMKDVIIDYPAEEKAVWGNFGQSIKVDVVEQDKDIVVKADLPGMEKDKIEITLEKERFLRIAGSREVEKKETEPGVVKQERTRGRFERVIELPVECLAEGIKATYKNGVLELVIPKKPAAKDEKVKIRVQ